MVAHSELRPSQTEQQRRIRGERAIRGSLIMFERFSRLAGRQQACAQAHAVFNGGRAVEIRARLAHGAIGVDQLCDGSRGHTGAARLAQARQVYGEEIHHAAQHWEYE